MNDVANFSVGDVDSLSVERVTVAVVSLCEIPTDVIDVIFDEASLRDEFIGIFGNTDCSVIEDKENGVMLVYGNRVDVVGSICCVKINVVAVFV